MEGGIMRITDIAKDGVCDFECWYCDIQAWCMEYNHKDNSPCLDQKEIRKQLANEQIMRGKM